VIPLKVSIVEKRPPDVLRDAWRDMLRESHAEAVRYFHHHLLPKHFRPDARWRYHYERRSWGYLKQKRAAAAKGRPFRKGQAPVVGGGITDLVLTGFMQQMLQSAAVVRAYPTRATITMVGPRYMTMRTFQGDRTAGYKYGKGQRIRQHVGQQPDKRRELTAITHEERREVAAVMDKTLQDKLNAFRQARTTTV
jgi:hypothetical protein